MALLPINKTKDYIFTMPFLRDNLIMIGVIGIIFGLLRIAAATGLWRNLLWSWWLAMIMCIITLILGILRNRRRHTSGFNNCLATNRSIR